MHRMKFGRSIMLSAALLCTGLGVKAADGPEWTEMFDGESLAGWERLNGDAEYTVEDGAIVGTTKPNTPNTFLTNGKLYGDFIMELEFKVDPRMNSGIQIRSNSFEEYNNGRVHGYQVEIDPSGRAWSGGIYDEARRGWLNNLADNEEAGQAFKQNEWNHYRIEAIGNRIRTWVNGVPAADLEDGMTRRGFIAFQVHSTNETEPMQIRWRNIRIRDLDAHAPKNDDPFTGHWEGTSSREGSPAIYATALKGQDDTYRIVLLDDRTLNDRPIIAVLSGTKDGDNMVYDSPQGKVVISANGQASGELTVEGETFTFGMNPVYY